MSGFFYFFSILLWSWCAQGMASQGAAAAGSSTAESVQPQAQLEEGWRWRESLDVWIHTKEGEKTQVLGVVDCDQIHQELYDWERYLTSYLANEYEESNIVVAAITLILQDGDTIGTITNFLQSDRQDPYYFPSRTASTFKKQDRRENWKCPTFPFKSNEALYQRINNFLSQPTHPAFLRESTNGLRKNLGSSPPPKEGGSFPMTFQHSEQKLVFYLMAQTSSSSEPNIFSFIYHILPRQYDRMIRAVILHIQSRRDPCQNCSKMLSLFAYKISTQINTFLGRNLKFLLLVSSRSTYENARFSDGHDGQRNSPITLTLEDDRQPDQHAKGAASAPPLQRSYGGRMRPLIQKERRQPTSESQSFSSVDPTTPPFFPPAPPLPSIDPIRGTIDIIHFHKVYPDPPFPRGGLQPLPN